MSLPPLPPYVYGREVAPNEKVWTESAVRELLAEGARVGMERAAMIAQQERDEYMPLAANNNGSRDSDFAFGSVNSAERIRDAIRAAAKQGGQG